MPRTPHRPLSSRSVRVLVMVAMLAALPGGCVDDCGYELEPRFQAMAGEGGVALSTTGQDFEGGRIEAIDAGGQRRDIAVGEGGIVVDPLGTPSTEYDLFDDQGEKRDGAFPETLEVLSLTTEPAVVDLDRTHSLDLRFEAIQLRVILGDLFVYRRTLPAGERQYLVPDCSPTEEQSCWGADEVAWQSDVRVQDLANAAVSAMPFTADLETPTALDTGLLFRVTDPATGDAVWSGGGVRTAVVEADLRWGDPHAHSNLSHDGCEDPSADCGHRGAHPGEDFFDNAMAAGLDFAAITDHAEWDEITSPDADPVSIWETTQQLVADAEQTHGPDFIPLLGYEWTHFVPVFWVVEPGEDPDPYADEFTAGHKTVLLDQASACDDYRVAAPTLEPTYDKGETGLTYGQTGVHPLADKAPALFEALDAAGQQCGAQGALTFFHHSAPLLPNPVNWALEVNEPDGHYERLVEIASEQGSSECRDITDEGCEFWINDTYANVHVQWGSVQEALSQGHRLGFTGGTDSHDGRPGSLEDGPSSLALYGDLDGDGTEDGPLQHPYSGAITGVWCQDDWSRAALWEALSARRTLASTGPRGLVAVAALDADGGVYLPGEEIPAAAFPLRIVASVTLDSPHDLVGMHLVEPDGGTVVAAATGWDLDEQVEDPGSPVLYLRIHANRGGEEHRMWVSPWFIDREG